MSDTAASSGLGMLLMPAQTTAAQGAAKTSASTATDALTDGNNESFSTVLAGQGEASGDVAATATVVQSGESASVEEQFADLQQTLTEALDAGQNLPSNGNPLPVVTTVTPVIAGSDSDLSTSTLMAATVTGAGVATGAGDSADSVSGSAAFDTESIIGQIVSSQSGVEAAGQSSAAAIAARQEATTALTTGMSTASDAGGLPSATALAAAASDAQNSQTPLATSSTAAADDQAAAAGLTLMSLLERKSRVGEPVVTADSLTLDLDMESSADSWLNDSLLSKNLQVGDSLSLTDEFAGLTQKTAELISAMSAKSPNSMDIQTLPAWRQQGLNGYASTPVATTVAIDVPVGKSGWGEAVMDKVMWMSSQNMESAEIALDPVDLGPMHVRISTHNDQTTVVFTSQHVQVREALDQASAQLRQQLENQGFSQVNVNVGGQSANQQQMAGDGQANGSAPVAANDSGDLPADTAAPVRSQSQRIGLVDTFA